MLRAQKKISKREIKEDKLITTYFQARTWLDDNRNRLGSIGGVVIVIILAIWFYSNNVRGNNEKAALDFGKVFTYYDNGQYSIAISGIPEKNVAGLQTIVDNYGSTRAGNMARFYLANAYYETQNFDKALEYFDAYSGGNDLLQISAYAGMASCYEAKNDFRKAAEYYEKAGVKKADDPNVAENLVNAARSYAKAGEKERALELLTKVKKEHPASPVLREYDRYLAEINS
jgi:tetratricopeptide (TPR) repeat protein